MIPQLSPSGPSIPLSTEHAPASFRNADFGLLTDTSFQNISNCSVFFPLSGPLEYASESDVVGFVKTFVQGIILALNLYCKLFTEVGIFNVRPDIWVVTTRNMLPIGVVEVKKPDIYENSSILDEPTVLGELYDFMLQLPNFYGIAPVFGVLTTMKQWRVCWFPTSEAGIEASKEETFEWNSMCATPVKTAEVSEQYTPPSCTPSKLNPQVYQLQEETCVEDDEIPVILACSERELCTSRIFNYNEPNFIAIRAIVSALLKIVRAKAVPVNSPFDKLETRTVIRFTKGINPIIQWAHIRHLHNNGKMNTIAKPQKYLYAIEDLGRGADGRVWLTCTHSGAICVLKFVCHPKFGQQDNLHHELTIWHKVYPFLEHSGVCEYWSGRLALRMPHFAAVPPSKRIDYIRSVESTLRNDFDSNRLVHHDVAWRNIGVYMNSDKFICAVVYDMDSVKDKVDKDAQWIERVLDKLTASI